MLTKFISASLLPIVISSSAIAISVTEQRVEAYDLDRERNTQEALDVGSGVYELAQVSAQEALDHLQSRGGIFGDVIKPMLAFTILFLLSLYLSQNGLNFLINIQL
jgi:hypothetical protein